MNKLQITSCELQITNDRLGKTGIAHFALRIPHLLVSSLLLLSLAGCSGGPPASPTAIPASVAQPQQPSPKLSNAQPNYGNDNAAPTVIIVDNDESAINAQLSDTVVGTPTPIQLLFQLPPSALGIATGGTTIVDTPGGAIVASIPAGSVLTVSGRSADGDFLAVYANSGISGWVPVGSLKLFGAEDLTVVEEAISPGPIATLMAEAMIPPATSALQAAMQEMMDTTPPTTPTPES